MPFEEMEKGSLAQWANVVEILALLMQKQYILLYLFYCTTQKTSIKMNVPTVI